MGQESEEHLKAEARSSDGEAASDELENGWEDGDLDEDGDGEAATLARLAADAQSFKVWLHPLRVLMG